MKICMFVYNACQTDARVLKEAGSLRDAGHEVRIVAVLDKTSAPNELRDGIEIIRIARNPIHYRLLRRVRSARRRSRLAWARLRRVGRRLLRRGPARLVRRFAHRVAQLRNRLDAQGRRTLGATVTAAGRRSPAAIAVGVAAALAAGLLSAVDAVAAGFGRLARGSRAGVRFALKAPRAVYRAVSHLAYRTLMRFHKPLMYFDWYLRAYKLLRHDPSDAFHAHDLNTLPVAVALARRTHRPLVYDAHELYPEVSTLSKLERRVWRTLEPPLIRRADHVITVCESIAHELANRYGVEVPSVLLNCPRATDGVAEPGLLRRKLGLPDDGRSIILYQGGFAPNRGLHSLVRSAHEFDDALVVLMGWGRLEDDLRRVISDERLEDRVIVTPPVPPSEVLAYTAGADIGVIPYEPVGLNNTFTTPNKLFDYLRCGLPVVGSRLPELVRFLERHGAGITFTPGDPHDLARAFQELLVDPDRLLAMGVRAKAAGAAYTWEHEAEKLIALYREDPSPSEVVGAVPAATLSRR